MWVAHPAKGLVLLKSSNILVCEGRKSHGVEAESTADERVTDRGRNQVEAPEGRVGGRSAATHPLAAKPRAPEARGERVKVPPGLSVARGVFVNRAAAKGGEPALC